MVVACAIRYRRSRFAPDRVAIVDGDGTVLEELLRPCASFADHGLQTPRIEIQLAYFAGCTTDSEISGNTPGAHIIEDDTEARLRAAQAFHTPLELRAAG